MAQENNKKEQATDVYTLLPAVLDEIICYIEQADQDGEWGRGNCRSLQEVIDAKDMPDIYYKLIELRNGR